MKSGKKYKSKQNVPVKKNHKVVTSKTENTESNWLLGWKPYAFIVAIAFLAHVQTLTYKFSGHDDDFMIEENARLKTDYKSPQVAFTTDAWFMDKKIELYRPLQSLTYMLDYSIAGTRPVAYHFTNLILFIITCCLIFTLLISLGIDRKLSFFSTIFFAVHYLFVNTVAWIPARGDLLLTLFCLLAIIYLIRYLENPKPLFIFVHALSCFMALLSKESALVLPVLSLVTIGIFKRPKLISRLTGFLTIYYVIIILVYLHLRNEAIYKASSTTGILSFVKNIAIIPESVSKFFLPYKLTMMPNFNYQITLIGSLILLILLFAIIKKKENFVKLLFYGLLWFSLFSIPAMAYRPSFATYGYDYLDHRDLLPMIGGIPVLVTLIVNYKLTNRFGFRFLFFTVLLVYGIVGFGLSKSYSNPISYFSQAIETNPTALAYTMRGAQWINKKESQKALDDFSHSIKLKPDYLKAYANRGKLFLELGRYDDASNDLKKVLETDSQNFEVITNLAIAKADMGKHDEAIKLYQSAIHLQPKLVEAYIGSAESKKRTGDFAGAISDLNKALEIFPDNSTAYFSRALIRAGTGDFENSLSDLNKTIALNPGNDVAFFFRARNKLVLKDSLGACADLKQAVSLGNNNAVSLIDKVCK
jgi:tetratricopeptide (TPR) repeat protein